MESVRVLKRVAAGLLVMAGASSASAEIAFAPTLFYNSEEIKNSSGTTSKEAVMTLDFRLGYVFDQNGLYLGGVYKYEDTSYTGGDNMKGFAIGPSIGYVNGGFSAIATYHIMAERKYTFSGTETKRTGGKGYQIDIAYAPQISSNFGLGPQLTYRSTKYDKVQVGGSAEASDSWELTTILPGFAFWFKF